MSDKPARRIKAFYLDADTLLGFFRTVANSRGDYLKIPELDADLPDDARVLTVDWRPEYMAFFIVVESESFDPVDLGQCCPMLTPDKFGGFMVTIRAYRREKDGAFRPLTDD